MVSLTVIPNPVFLCSYRAFLLRIVYYLPLGRPRRRWEDNIKMDLQEVGRRCGDWMELAQYRDRWRAFVSTVMK